MRAYRYIRNGESLSLDQKACVGCGLCVEVCPHAVFAMDGGAETVGGRSPGGSAGASAPAFSRKVRIDDRSLCMECGACAMNCPAGALSVKAGVGCAAAIILGKLRGTAPDCGACCATGDGAAGDGAESCAPKNRTSIPLDDQLLLKVSPPGSRAPCRPAHAAGVGTDCVPASYCATARA